MRDPNSWKDPDKVSAREVLEFSFDYLSLNYILFGSGRRGCPRSNLGNIFVGVATGIMVQCFDWRINGDKINMEETGDMTLSMAQPLKCTPLTRINPLAM